MTIGRSECVSRDNVFTPGRSLADTGLIIRAKSIREFINKALYRNLVVGCRSELELD